jgi:hypothetical protein
MDNPKMKTKFGYTKLTPCTSKTLPTGTDPNFKQELKSILDELD